MGKIMVRSAGGKVFELDGNSIVEVFKSVYSNDVVRIPAYALSPGMVLLGAGRIDRVVQVGQSGVC